jgi:UDP-N-acetylglucosamine:LPS N-acetylglucosamine transferase
MTEEGTKAGEVLVLSAAAGAGHIRCAEALASAFAAKGIPAKHVEVLKYASWLFKKVYSDLYIELVNHQPAVLGLVYDAMDHPWKYRKRLLALDWLNTWPLVRLLLASPPRIAVCTHFLPALAYKIDTLLADRERFDRMRQAVRRLARPNAAADVVSLVSGVSPRN